MSCFTVERKRATCTSQCKREVTPAALRRLRGRPLKNDACLRYRNYAYLTAYRPAECRHADGSLPTRRTPARLPAGRVTVETFADWPPAGKPHTVVAYSRTRATMLSGGKH